MNREKRIEEIADLEHLLRIRRLDIEKQGCDIWALIKNNTSEEQAIAEYLIGHNYRKASEVVEEVFEQIKKKAFPHYYGGIPVITRADIDGIEEELKEKYAEGEE